MGRPVYTRLRWVSYKKESTVENWLRSLNFRVEIKSISWQESKKQWVMWFVPDDSVTKDVISGNLKDKSNG